ncbi:TPA: DNA cytosine methyltransferase [Pseudomonas aeruginosa]|nr:DNA cytosine methyltransferase [Pseudomonas aeruginosa]HEJ3838078.1 DNA cytosine methyltransferase [Pseudomonas aeruginosa]HEK1287239.1 DNA cytosine methyltransferase [Pseudomonas aeruginosa]
MSYGFHATEGFLLVGAVDAQRGKPSSGAGTLECNKTYEANIGIRPLNADLSSVKPEQIDEYLISNTGSAKIDILISCAPCTGFSRTLRKNLVEDDARNSLVANTSIFVEHYSPKIFVMENVGELLQGKFKHHFEILHGRLTALGYKIKAEVHNLSKFGLPQNRKRALIIAVKQDDALPAYDLSDLWDGYEVNNRATTVRAAISNLPPLTAGEACSIDVDHVSPKFSPPSIERLSRIPADGGSWFDLMKLPNGEDYLIPSMKSQLARGRVGPYPDVYGRMKWDAPSVTIKRECSHTGNGRYAHPEQNRLCTVRELGILQGFPKHYRFVASSLSNRYRHIGDAVPPLVSYQIAATCKWILEGRRPSINEAILPDSHLTPNDIIKSQGSETNQVELELFETL